jgi:hypothetical protein
MNTLDEQAQVDGYRALLEKLIERPELRTSMGHAAFQAASNRTWDDAMGQLLQGYQELAQPARELAVA